MKNDSGSSLLMAILAVASLTYAMYSGISGLVLYQGEGKKAQIDYEMEMVAGSALEIGKYLIFYEKIINLDEPLKTTSTIQNTIVGDDNWLRGCGSVLPDEVKKLRIPDADDGTLVFCPYIIRDSRVRGQTLETQFFESLAANSIESGVDVITKPSGVDAGEYKLKTLYFDKDDYSTTEDSTDVYTSPIFKFNLEEKIKKRIEFIKLDIYFYTEKAGFITQNTERFMKFVATVQYKPKPTLVSLYTRQRTVSESVMYIPSTMKEYALFLPYPTPVQTTITNADVATTRKLSEAVKMGSGSNIYGKTYFRGDIDATNLDTLPNFQDLLVLGGTFTTIFPPNENNISKFKEKFKKGVMLHFGDNLLMDVEPTDDMPGVFNATGGLESGGSIKTYTENKVGTFQCSSDAGGEPVNITISATGVSSCGDIGANASLEPLFGGGLKMVTTTSQWTFILAAARGLKISTANAEIYGTYLGGFIDAGTNNVNFYSLPAISTGLLGVVDEAGLAALNTNASTVNQGISVPLRNLGLILLNR